MQEALTELTEAFISYVRMLRPGPLVILPFRGVVLRLEELKDLLTDLISNYIRHLDLGYCTSSRSWWWTERIHAARSLDLSPSLPGELSSTLASTGTSFQRVVFGYLLINVVFHYFSFFGRL